jgi:hypothetical protein
MKVETIGDGADNLCETVQTLHLPGHSPDALALRVGEEVILTGDTVLPEITPFPTREAFSAQVRGILPPTYAPPDSLFGLRAYIRSLRKLERFGEGLPNALVLPSHRLFHDGHFNELHLKQRIAEIIEHHIDRCADILRILKRGPKTAGEIALEHFSATSLKGVGTLMAENEILSHCELMAVAGDVRTDEDGHFLLTGTGGFESTIRSLASDSLHP